METPLTTDVFKFMALRPPERRPDAETRRTIIRDARASEPHGVQQLTRLARELSAGAARERWPEFGLSRLEPWADAHHRLVQRYASIAGGNGNRDGGPPAPDGWQLLNEADERIGRDRPDPELVSHAWDMLYAAQLTGADAGPRLEVPMAALRVLHFAALLDEQPRPEPAAALEALSAKPAVPTAFHEAVHAPAVRQPDPQRPPTPGPADPARSDQLRGLAREIDATERLLEAVTNAPALAAPMVRPDAVEPAGGPSRGVFSISTVPDLRATLGAEPSAEQVAVLDRLRVGPAAPVPVAAQALEAHLATLNRQALELAGDVEFRQYVMEAKTSVGGAKHPIADLIPVDPGTAPEVDVSGRITPLGIGDLKVVKQTLLAYVPGEVAHIENVLKGESKERKHRNLDRIETTVFTAEEETRETQRDTQSTERFELKREAEQTIKEDLSIKAGLTVTATFGPVVTTASGEFAYATSKQESQKSSSNFAREVVDRAITKVQTKTRAERTTKTLAEVEEITTHGVDNSPPGAEHVTGIYRWVDKRYRAQVYNYGVRLMFEFVVPEPAAFYRAAHTRPPARVDAKPPAPFHNGLGQPLTAADITEGTYQRYAAKYGATGVNPPPPLYTYTGLALAPKDGLGEGKSFAIAAKEFVVPAGYTLAYYSATVSVLWINYPQFSLQIGRDLHEVMHDTSGKGVAMHLSTPGFPEAVVNAEGSIPLSIACYDVLGFALNVQGVCKRTTTAMDKWQVDTFEKIQTAYQALQTAYDQKVSQAEAQAAAGIAIEGRNPAANRVVEKTELKKLCVTMMTGQHFKQFTAMTDPDDKPTHYPEPDVLKTLDDGPVIQFFEQAFEWEQMTYLFYPYFWGRKANWTEVSNLSDPDPLFGQFLSAGAARVLVPVPLAYADAVLYLLQNPNKATALKDKVWRGGERPTIGSPLYISIAEEIRNQTDDLAGATPEGTPWEFTIPTQLVWLQSDATLPTFG